MAGRDSSSGKRAAVSFNAMTVKLELDISMFEDAVSRLKRLGHLAPATILAVLQAGPSLLFEIVSESGDLKRGGSLKASLQPTKCCRELLTLLTSYEERTRLTE